MKTIDTITIDLERTSPKLITAKIASMAVNFSVNPDRCSNPELYHSYLMFEAFDDRKTGRATTHVLIDDVSKQILGYVSLRATSLLTSSSPLIGEPAIEIYMLAVDSRYEHQGVGSMLIDIALEQAATLREDYIGIQHIVLAADPKAVGFYKTLHFSELADWLDTIPLTSRSIDCVPMIMKLRGVIESPFAPEFCFDIEEDEPLWPFD